MSSLRVFIAAATVLSLSSCYATQHQYLPQDATGLPKRVDACLARHALLPEQSQYQGIFTPAPPPGDLANFASVASGLYRGARPTARGLCLLKELGIKTVISLENLEAVVDWEKKNSETLGLQFINLPMSVFSPPTPDQVSTFLAQVQDPARKPVYFHCMQGSDRTGTMGLVYRISVDHWDFERAYREMQQHGFHEYLLGLQAFIRAYGQRQQP